MFYIYEKRHHITIPKADIHNIKQLMTNGSYSFFLLSILIQKNNILIKDTIIGKIHKMKLFILQNIFCYQKPHLNTPNTHLNN
ncbi:hypothetical protein DW989_04075 [Bacteroides stercoris]|nr:hypothetical protein DW989_04075 [Bacteroides stercoris]